MTLKASIILVALAAAFSHGNGCPPSPQPPAPDASDAAPPPPPPADGGSQTDYNLACAALALAGCPEGQKANCATSMQQRAHDGVGNDNPKCVLACHDKACVHGCTKDIRCP